MARHIMHMVIIGLNTECLWLGTEKILPVIRHRTPHGIKYTIYMIIYRMPIIRYRILPVVIAEYLWLNTHIFWDKIQNTYD